ncbi:hypothetical protein D3C87_1896520 [compost metagenome]
MVRFGMIVDSESVPVFSVFRSFRMVISRDSNPALSVNTFSGLKNESGSGLSQALSQDDRPATIQASNNDSYVKCFIVLNASG